MYNTYSFKKTNGEVIIHAVTDSIIRVIYTKTGELPKPSLICNYDTSKSALMQTEETDKLITLSTKAVKIVFDKITQSIKYYSLEGKLYRQDTADAFELEEKDIYCTVYGEDHTIQMQNTVDGMRMKAQEGKTVFDRKGCGAKLNFNFQEKEAIYGLGSHEGETLNLRGHTEYLYAQNYKACVPVLVSSLGYGLLFDCMSYMKFQDERESSMYFDVLDNNCLDFYIMFGPALDDVVKGYRYLTGKSPMLPKWAFGYWQSKERYETQQEMLDIVSQFKQRAIPLDAIVLDWKSWPGKFWGQKSFDAERFPNPEEMTQKMHDSNKHMVISIWPNMYPGGENHTEMLKHNYLLGNLSVYNAFDENARQMYWKHANEGLFCNGIDGWWCDCTEPFETDWHGDTRMDKEQAASVIPNEFKKYIDPAKINAFSLYHSMGIYEGQRSTTAKKRVVNLTRSAYAGQQRFSTITWSGDISARWDVLYRQIAAGLNFSVTGNPYWTFDSGAFFVNNKPGLWFWKGQYPDGCEDLGYRELYTRWLQLGAFMPVFRSHGTDTPREPWRFGNPGEMFYDSIVATINLRYKLMPYIYSLAGDVTLNGGTILRLLAFDNSDGNVLDIKDQFMFGPSIMVCPVTQPMYYESGSKPLTDVKKQRKVYLPAGKKWYDFYTDKVYEGGGYIEASAPIDIIPLFVPEGSIIAQSEAAMSTSEQDNKNIKLKIYPGKDANFVLYFDSGDTYNYENGEYCLIELLWNDEKKKLTIGTRNGAYPEMDELLTFEAEVAGKADKRTVSYNGSHTEVDF